MDIDKVYSVRGHFSSEMPYRSGMTTENDLSFDETKLAAMTGNEQQVIDLIEIINNNLKARLTFRHTHMLLKKKSYDVLYLF